MQIMYNSNKQNIFPLESNSDTSVLQEGNLSVHNISMNAVLSSTLNLDSIYKYFSNCIYKPRDFKCIRIDVPVSKETIDKYINYKKKKREQKESKKRKRQEAEEEKEKQMYSTLLSETPCNELVKGHLEKNEESSSNETNYKIRCIEQQQRNQELCNPMKNNIYTAQNKNGMLGDEYLLEQHQVLDTKSAADDSSVLELLSEINSPDADFNESEKIIINVSLFANGKLICTGNNSVEACKIAMKKIENKLKEYNVKNIKLRRVTITNILAVYNAGFSIVLPLLAQCYKNVDYDPNVFPACKVKIALENNSEKSPKAANEQGKDTAELAWASTPKESDSDNDTKDIISASIFSTGNITLTGAKNYENLKRTIQILLPYLYRCRSQRHQKNGAE